MSSQAERVADNGSLDRRILEEDAVSIVSLSLTLISGATIVFLFGEPRLTSGQFFTLFSFFLLSLAAYLVPRKYLYLSRMILLLGPVLSLSLAIKTFYNPFLPYYACFIVVANALTNPIFGFVSAAICSVTLWALVPLGEPIYYAWGLIWLITGLQWIGSRSLYTVLGWAWSTEERASRLLDQLRVRQGELNRTLVALNEATWRLQHNGYELSEAILRADRAREMKERFAANISHELRTPLNLILGFSEMMHLSREVYGDMNWPPALRRDVRRIYEASRQLLNLVNDVLDLSRMDVAEMAVHSESDDLAVPIQEAVSIVSDMLHNQSLVVQAKLPETLPMLRFDRMRIRQVLLNLLTNAGHFTEEGSITVTAEIQGQEVVVHVADTGVGISADELSKIFDEFHQVGTSLYRRQGGAGLGLAISKRFIELHGGRIWAESEPGRGSTFHFSLPLADDPVRPARPGRSRTRQPHPNSGEHCLVVVDSDPGLSSVLGRQLTEYRVVHARVGEPVKSLVTAHHPLVVLQNTPPDGLEESLVSCLRLQNNPADVPLLICSIPNQTWMARQARVSGYLTKPVSREQILSAIAAVPDVEDILIVDDDDGFVQLVVRLLQGAERLYRVRWAYRGIEAFDLIRERQPDLILLDLVMPEMNGTRFVELLHADERTARIPVIIITGNDYPQEALDAYSGVIALVRQRAYSLSEIARYSRALLDATEISYLGDTMPEQPAIVAD